MDRDNVFTYSLFLLLSLSFTIIVGGGGQQQQQPLLLSQKVKGEEKPLPPIPSLAKPMLKNSLSHLVQDHMMLHQF